MISRIINKFRKQHTELHTCPHCGASIQRLYLVAGGIVGPANQPKVKAILGCRDCRKTHSMNGSRPKDHWLVLVVSNNPVRVYTHATTY